MENNFQKQFDQSITKWCNSGLKLLVGVSGGADSMLLLHSLLNTKKEIRPQICVAHINHKLREASDYEEQFVRNYCDERCTPFFSEQWTDETRFKNTEKKARDFRYAFFLKISEKENIDAVLTAHHADDQAETLLMRIGKGCQLKSLSGIPYVSDRDGLHLIRPLLLFTKKNILDACRYFSLPYVEDESNGSLNYQRNRVRHTILSPYKKEYPSVISNLSELSKQVDYSSEIVKKHSQELIDKHLIPIANGFQISLFVINELSDAELYFFLVEFFQQLFIDKGNAIESKHIHSIMDLLKTNKVNKRLSLPMNWMVEKTYSDLIFYKEAMQQVATNELHKIDLNEILWVSNSSWFELKEVQSEDISKKATDKNSLYLPRSIAPPFFIRKIVEGDRFVYNSNGQKKKISRYFIDEKITREQRLRSWVVLDASDEILWIVPYRQSYLCNLKETDRILFELKFNDEDNTIEGSSQSGPRY